MGTTCCSVSIHSLSSSFLSSSRCWWLLGLSVSSRRSPRLGQWLHSKQCSGRVWKHGQQSRSCHQTASLPLCVQKYAFSVSDFSHLHILGHSLSMGFRIRPLFCWSSPSSASVSLFCRVWRQPSVWLRHPYLCRFCRRKKPCKDMDATILSWRLSSNPAEQWDRYW